MKFKTTNKEIKNRYGNNIITIGYCQADCLLAGQEPAAYTCGVDGWNSDIYLLDSGYCISTGYRPIEGVHIDDGALKQANEEAKKIYNAWGLEDASKNELINNILYGLIGQL